VAFNIKKIRPKATPKQLPQFVKKVKAGKEPKRFLKPPPRVTGTKPIAPSDNAVPDMLAKIGALGGSNGNGNGGFKKKNPFSGM
jgi:hypothetical protein